MGRDFFLLEVLLEGRVPMHVGHEPRPVRGQRAPDRTDGLGRMRHVVDAVEGGDQVVAAVLLETSVRRVVDGQVVELGGSGVGKLERHARVVEAVELRLGERAGHHLQRLPTTASDVRDLGSFAQLGLDAIERRTTSCTRRVRKNGPIIRSMPAQ